MKRLAIALVLLGTAVAPAYASPAAQSFYLEDLTWPEVHERMQHGTDTIIIPTGGTEQNGPHIVIGKHNRIVRYTSGEIAKELGNALAAPVLAYVPEGKLDDKEGHMAFPGTITASDDAFARILEDAARSFKRHGFKHICFIGDHGGNQTPQQQVAEKLSKEWKSEGVTVLQVSDYYADKEAADWAAAQKMVAAGDPAAHAGFMDTSEAMALDKNNVRSDKIAAYSEKDFPDKGVLGDPSKASAENGKKLLAFKVKAAVEQIRKALPATPTKQ